MQKIVRRAARLTGKVLGKGRNALGYLTKPSEAEIVATKVQTFKEQNSGLLTGKVVAITGSTRGIGLAIATGFSQLGASVVINGRNQNLVETVTSKIRAAGGRVAGVVADVGTPEGARQILETTVSTFGTVDILINNAGVNLGGGKPIWEISPEEQAETLRINVLGPFLCLSVVSDWMVKNGVRGRILNVSSGAGVSAMEKLSPYGVSKFGLEGLTKYAAQDLSHAGIAVVTIQPGSVQTDMTREQFGWIGSQELAPPESVLPTVVFAATAPAEAVNGRVLSVWRYGCDPHAEPLLGSGVATTTPLSFAPFQYRGESVAREDENITVYDRAESQFDVAPQVVEAIRGVTARTLRFYPDLQVKSLREALAEEHGLSTDCFSIGPGSSELICRLINLFLKVGENAVANDPGWFGFDMFCARAGVTVKRVPFQLAGPENRPHHNLSEILRAVDVNTRLVYLISPSNPEGVPLRQQDFARFLEELPPHLPVIVDEAYFEYADDDDIVNCADLVCNTDRIVVGLRTFSKFYGLANLRAGYAMAAPRICNLLERAAIPFNISTIAERAAVAALMAKNHRLSMQREISDERTRIQAEIGELGLEYIPSQNANILVELPCDMMQFYNHYEKNGIFLSKSAFFGGRLTMFPVGRREQNNINLAILRSLV